MRAIKEDRPQKFTASAPGRMPLWLEIAIGVFTGGMAIVLTTALLVAIGVEHQKREAIRYLQHQFNEFDQIINSSKRR